MKSFFARHKKQISFVGVLSLAVACAVSASAVTYGPYPTSRYHSHHEEHSDGSHYFKTEYHVGSSAPWDDAYVYAEAGAEVFKDRYMSYSFGGHVSSKHSFSGIGSGVQSDSYGYTLSGQDTGTGWCYACTRTGWDTSDPIDKDMELVIR